MKAGPPYGRCPASNRKLRGGRTGRLLKRLDLAGGNGGVDVAIEFIISRNGFTIRPAGTQDARALRMLLPELRNGAEHFVAVDGQHQLVIGAAAATQSCRTQPLTGPGVALAVIEPCRRQGIATGLLTHLENAAQQTFDASALYAAKRVEQGSAEMQGWQWLGFVPIDTVEEHVLPVEQFELRLGPLVDRMRAKGAFHQMHELFRCTRRTLRPCCSFTSTRWAATAASCIASCVAKAQTPFFRANLACC